MRPFIQDTERVLNSANDLLKTSVYADNLVNVIENTPKDKVFTIGVFGGWGTGKSSIIRTAQEKIEKLHGDVRFITYDAWKYANDSFRRMFLLKIQQELKMNQTEEMSRFYQSETVESEPRTTLSAKGVAFAVIVLAIVSIILFLIPSVSLEWKVAVPSIGTLGTFLLTLLKGCFYDLKITYDKPALFAPEQFESCFKEMMSKCLKRKNWFQKTWCSIKDFVMTGEASIVGLEKLAIVIDNIDRCPSDMAYQLLTDIKTFLSNEEYNLVFIIPVDDEALKKHLFRRWNNQNREDINKEKEEFLRKFFNVALRIKPHQETELQHFAHEINRENGLGYSNDTLAIVAKEFADNPRRIIQLMNNLNSELSLYKDDFARKNEEAICASLILREEYPEHYRKATKNLQEVYSYQAGVADKDASLNAFMRISEVIFRQTPIDALRLIFTNTDSIFSDLSSDVQSAIRTYDAPAVLSSLKEDDVDKDTLFDYLLEQIRTDVKYNATSQTTQWIDMVGTICKASMLDKTRLSEIDGLLSPFYSSAIAETSDPISICFLASKMKEVGLDRLRASVIAFLNSMDEDKSSGYADVLKSYLHVFTSSDDCDAIAKTLTNYYVDKKIDQTIPFSDIQISRLFNDSFVFKQIETLSSLNDESKMDDIIWCLRKNDSLSKKVFDSLFKQYVALFGETRGKSKEAYLQFIERIIPSFYVIKTNSLNKELESIVGLISNPRSMPSPSRPQYIQYDTQVVFLDEVVGEEAKNTVALLYEIMRISGGSIDVSPFLGKLFSKCQEAVISGALRIHSSGVSISSLANVLVQTQEYSSIDDLKVLELVLTRQDNGQMMLDENTIKTKVNELIENADNKDVESLLIRLAQDRTLLDIITRKVASLDSKTVNSLPISISKYAVSTFGKDNSSAYKDNQEFLILVLRQGKAEQKSIVAKLMMEKMVNESDLDLVFTVLENLTTENQSLVKPLVRSLENLRDSDTVDEESKIKASGLISKYSSVLNPVKKSIKKLLRK